MDPISFELSVMQFGVAIATISVAIVLSIILLFFYSQSRVKIRELRFRIGDLKRPAKVRKPIWPLIHIVILVAGLTVILLFTSNEFNLNEIISVFSFTVLAIADRLIEPAASNLGTVNNTQTE